MKIKAIQAVDSPLEIVPGGKQREWMDDTVDKYAYRCLPLQIANTLGWDVYAPCDFVVNWNGSAHVKDLHINFEREVHPFCVSNFGHGIFTMHTGYIFKTEPGWDMLCTGPINQPVEFASAMTGVVETSWLNFSFTMNWKLHKPGTYYWDKRVPVARLIPIPHEYDVETEVTNLNDESEVLEEYKIWCQDRDQITKDSALAHNQEKDVGGVEYAKKSTHWEKNYYTGTDKFGNKIDGHITTRKFPEF